MVLSHHSTIGWFEVALFVNKLLRKSRDCVSSWDVLFFVWLRKHSHKPMQEKTLDVRNMLLTLYNAAKHSLTLFSWGVCAAARPAKDRHESSKKAGATQSKNMTGEQDFGQEIRGSSWKAERVSMPRLTMFLTSQFVSAQRKNLQLSG
jgi:hypothetical protein